MDKETRISDMVDIAPVGGDRSWNILFCHEFQDWEIGVSIFDPTHEPDTGFC